MTHLKTFLAVLIASLLAGAVLLNQQNRIRRWETNSLAVTSNMQRATTAIESNSFDDMAPRIDLLGLRITLAESHAANAPLGTDTKQLLQAIEDAKRTKRVYSEQLSEEQKKKSAR